MPGEDNSETINQLRNSLADQFYPPAAAGTEAPNPQDPLENTNLEAQYLPYLSSDKIIIIDNLKFARYDDSIKDKFDITASPIGPSQIQQNTKCYIY